MACYLRAGVASDDATSMHVWWLLLGAMALTQATWAEAPPLSGKPEIVDGDGLKLGTAVIRLHGIDAPELAQSCRRPFGED